MLTLHALSSSLSAGTAKTGCWAQETLLGAVRQSVPQNGHVHSHIIEYVQYSRANGSLITPITFTYSLQSREWWPLSSGKTPETLRELFLESPSSVRLGSPKCYLDSRRLYCRTRGRIFSEMIQLSAQRSELQAKSRSYSRGDR